MRTYVVIVVLPLLFAACGTPLQEAQEPQAVVPDIPRVNFGMEVPDPGDLPGVPMRSSAQVNVDTLPGKVDLSPWFPPPGNQHEQFSCAAWAWAYGVQSYCSNRRNNRFGRRSGTPNPDQTYSPSYIFNLFKQVGDTTPCNTGIDIDRFIDFCGYAGICSMSEVPYDTSLTGCQVRIPPTAMSMGMSLAAQGQVPGPTWLSQHDLTQWKAHLAAGEPLMVLFIVDRVSFCNAGFEAARQQRPFTWDLTTFNGVNSGGHAMVCAGYDDSDSTLLVMNSFGQAWGTMGYVKIPYVNVRKKSYGAYAFPIDPPGKMRRIVAVPVVDSVRTGLDTTYIPMNQGEYVIVNGVKLVFTELSANGIFATVAVSHTDSRNAPSLLRMQKGSDWTFFDNGKSITFSWTPSTVPGSAALFEAISASAMDDPAIRAYQQQLREAGHFGH